MTLARIRVILGAAVTWLVTLAAIIVILIDELGGIAGLPPIVVRLLGTALTIIGVAIAIIRRVTPVLPTARGILDNGQPNTGLEAIGNAALRNASRRGAPAVPTPHKFDPTPAKPIAGDPFERDLGQPVSVDPPAKVDPLVDEQFPGEFA